MLFGVKRTLQSSAPHAGKRERAHRMSSTYGSFLFMILFGLVEGFMIWAFWNFYKASHRR
jgi:hypothetical protein